MSPDNLTKEIELNMVLNVPASETEDTVLDKFIEWVESNGWLCGGGVKDMVKPKL